MARWKPSKTKAREFAEQMSEIKAYCEQHGISYSKNSDSYYFTVDDQKYRVSNHTIEASNRGAYHELYGQMRDEYHPGGREDNIIYITAGKTRIIDIHKDLLAGKILDKRGNEIKPSLSLEVKDSREASKELNATQKATPARATERN